MHPHGRVSQLLTQRIIRARRAASAALREYIVTVMVMVMVKVGRTTAVKGGAEQGRHCRTVISGRWWCVLEKVNFDRGRGSTARHVAGAAARTTHGGHGAGDRIQLLRNLAQGW